MSVLFSAIWGRISGPLTAFWALLRKYPLQSVIVAMACLSAFLWWRLDSVTSALNTERSEHKAASRQAAKDQVSVNHVPAQKSRQIAEQSNADSQSYYEQGRLAGLAYANAHRVRGKASQCSVGHPDLPGANSATQVDDGAGDASDMVAVSQADYATLTANSLRLAKVHQDAQSLIASGVATSSETPQ